MYVLFQKIVFKSTSKHRTVLKQVVEMRRGSISEGDNDYYSNQPLLIPPIPPSQLIGCNIIDIQYNIIVSMNEESMSLLKRYVYICQTT